MRALSTVFGLWLAVLSPVSPAAEPVSEPHAMVYFQTQWSGRAQDTRATLGLRLDRGAAVENGVIEYQRLLQRPAMLDFRLGREGVQAFSVAGTDYLAWYRVHHADEAGAATAEAPPAPEGEGAEPAPPAPAKAEPEPKEEKATVSGFLNKAPVGIIIGVGIGIVLVSGVGG